MSQMMEGAVKSYPSTAALLKHRRVKMSAGVLAYAGATDLELGTLEETTFATDLPVNAPVRLRTAQGTAKFVALDGITAFNPFYAAANGKVSASGTVLIGIAQETTTTDLDVLEGLRRHEASDSAASGGTTAAAFEVDSDSATPKIALAGQTGGTGDYTTTLKPESTLSADNAIIVPEADGDTLVAVGLAQTLTNKTLTAPVVNTPLVKDATEVVAATNVIAATETGTTFFLNHATEFVSTLPAPAAGLNFKFIVTGAPSGASYTIVTNSSANIIKGNVVTSEDAAGDFETSGGDTITFVDGQAVAGDMVELHCDGTNWFAYGRSKVAAGITITTAS
jgi:hypothetical protein